MYRFLFAQRHTLALLSLISIGMITYGLYVLNLFGNERKVECRGCNVILISIDTLGAKHTSVHDPSLNTTPFLQSYAKNSGQLFLNAYSQAPWTLPSHGSMLSGLYPWDLKLRHPLDTIGSSTDMLAEMLQRSGYHTAAFSTGAFVQPFWGFNQGFDEFHVTPEPEAAWNDAPRIFNEALTWLTQEKDKPFFLFIHSFHPHDPYGSSTDAISIHDIVESNTHTMTVDTATNVAYRTAYRKEISEIDISLENFLSSLQRSRHGNNTIVIITSDHGEEFNEHGSIGLHGATVHSELLHVPLILHVPHVAAASFEQSVEVRSLPATILDLVTSDDAANANMAPSLASLIEGTETTHRLSQASTYLERKYLLNFFKDGYLRSPNLIRAFLDENPIPPEQKSAIFGNIHGIQDTQGNITAYDMPLDPDEQLALPIDTITSPTDEMRVVVQALQSWTNE